MKRPLRKDLSGAGGAALGTAVGILAIGALRQWASVDPGPVESAAIITVATAAVSFVASYFVPLSSKETETIGRGYVAAVRAKAERY